MKSKVNRVLSWFEKNFNFYIEALAFLGGLFCLVFALALFVIMLVDIEFLENSPIIVILLPGFIGFFGVMILFALRITRFLTRE
jgi:hypothetical protein